jgi:predicted Zn finger-like uncharacterized protein
MNVSCPECKTVFRVDPEKVPVNGVRARCSVCSAVFRVERERSQPKPAPVSAPVPASAPAPAISAAPPPPATPPAQEPALAPSRPTPRAEPVPSGTRATAPFGQAFAPPPAVTTSAPARPVNPFLAQDPMAKARRLARALVSDIVVYNPAKRRDGLRDGSLKTLFEEEIRKSWEEYVDQVGRELADSTSFFTDALNEILADGQRVFS